MFSNGDRVFAKPYGCFGKIVKIEHQEKLVLTDRRVLTVGFAIPAGNIYWVELEGRDLRPRGFSDHCLRIV